MVLEPERRLTAKEIMQTEWFSSWIQPALEKVEQIKAPETTCFSNDTAAADIPNLAV